MGLEKDTSISVAHNTRQILKKIMAVYNLKTYDECIKFLLKRTKLKE